MRTILINWMGVLMKSFVACRVVPVQVSKAQAKLGPGTVGAKSLDSGVLFAGNSVVVITHGPEIYRLRLTRQNRLILTK